MSLPAILRHLEARAATLVLLRGGLAPVFWKGNELLEDQGGFPIQSDTDVRIAICVPLTDEQLARYRKQNVLAVELRIKDLGAFHFEAYVQRGREELVISSAERTEPWSLFRAHHELLAEARQSPADADTYWNLGVAFIEDGEYQLAWHAFEKARELEPDDGTILFEIGKLLGHDLCRVDEAILVLERVIASSPTLEATLELAVMLRSSSRRREAEAAIRAGLATYPDDARLLEALGVVLIELDQAREAIAVLERCLELHGADPEIEALLLEARSAG